MCLTFEFLITNFLIFVRHSKAIFWGFKLNSKVHKCVCVGGFSNTYFQKCSFINLASEFVVYLGAWRGDKAYPFVLS